jgi:signal peptidase I
MAGELTESKRSRSKLTIVIVLASSITIFLCFLSIFISLASDRIRIESISMQPSLYPGDYVLINKIAYNLNRTPRRGEVIVFKYPPKPDAIPYIKRVIGIPGDRIQITNGKIYINGELMEEPYIKVATNHGGDWTVPSDQYFVMGDNRNNSSDSRAWGYVPSENIIGRAELIYMPPQHWSILH